MMKGDAGSEAPGATLRVRDGVALTVGMVVGIGVFKTPSLVAARLDDPAAILALWAIGALIVLVGALCYAELASTFPDAGGEYHFLVRAFGPGTGFLFAWGRLAVVQTGAIAAVAFVLGDYAQWLLPLGTAGPALYAALAVVVVTALNVRGTRISASVQNALAAALAAAILGAAVMGFLLHSGAPAPPAATSASTTGGSPMAGVGFAMIFVMLTYGGWNEAAYLSAELRDVRRTMIRVLALGTLAVATLYLLLNGAYLHVLGPAAMRASDAVGADYMKALVGVPGAVVLALVVIVAALTTLNATVFTGARSIYAMSCNTPMLSRLGRWDGRAQGPVNAHIVQAALALVLIGTGAVTRQGFTSMVEYTAPVFWFFLLLTGFAVFVMRRRGLPEEGFRIPLYPLTPILFCASSGYMLHAALVYTGAGALFGVGVVALGLPIWWLSRRHRLRPAG